MAKWTKLGFLVIGFLLIGSTLFGQSMPLIRIENALTHERVADAHIRIESVEGKVLWNGISDVKGEVDYTGAFPVVVEVKHTAFNTWRQLILASEVILLEPAAYQIPEVTVLTTFVPTDTRKSMQTIRILDEETFRARGAQNLQQALKQELNVRISQDPVLGSGVSLQGLGGEQIKILVDGVPVIGRLNGNIDLSQINLNDIERIEIIEGPLSLQYGTNALGGVINLVSKKLPDADWQLGAQTFYESVGVYNVDAMVGFRKDQQYVKVTGGRYFFDGFQPDGSRERDVLWNPKEQYFAGIKYGYTAKSWRMNLHWNGFREVIQNKGEIRRPQMNAFDDYYQTIRSDQYIQFSGEGIRNHYWDQTLAFNFFQRRKNTWFKDLVTLEEVLTPVPENHDTSVFMNYMARGVLSRTQDWKKWRYQVGYDVNIESGRGQRIFEGNQWMGDFAGFAQLTWSPTKTIELQPGARYSYHTAYRAPVSPVFQMRFNPHAHWIVRASYARGFRAPDLKELYFFFVDINHNIQGNPNLKAEYSHNAQLSLQWTPRWKDHPLDLQLSGFYNHIQNSIQLIMLDASENLWSNINVGQFRTAGVQGRGRMFIGNQWTVGTGYSYTGRQFYQPSQLLMGEMRFSHEATLDVQYTLSKFQTSLNVFYKWNGRLNMLWMGNDDVVEAFIDPFHVLDVSINQPIWQQRLHLSAGVKNLLNVTNVAAGGISAGFHQSAQNSSMMAWGRTFFAAVRLDIKKQKS